MARTRTYFAAASGVSLDSVCNKLRKAFSLPEFRDDYHDTWHYAYSHSPAIGFNVTKANDSKTIETWVEGCPSGVNFQIIADYEIEPQKLIGTLQAALGAEPIRHATSTGDTP